MLSYLCLHVAMEARETVELPAYAGSTLRGAFMSALKQTRCMGSQTCGDVCDWPSTCAYGFLCETPVPRDAPGRIRASKFAPHPFVISPPEGGMVPAGGKLRFELTLWGTGLRHLPAVLQALEQMAAAGMGRGRKKLRLIRGVDANTKTTLSDGSNISLADVAPQSTQWNTDKTSHKSAALRVDFTTPAKLKSRGELVTEFDFGELVYHAADRLYLLCHCHGDTSFTPNRGELASRARDADVKLVEDTIRRVSFARYSQRQARKHRLDGVMGHLLFVGDIGPFLSVLRSAELFHLGKGTSFGLGAIEVRVEGPPVSKD